LPVLNNAVSVVLNSDFSIFQEVRIAVGPVAAVPWRAEDAESYLQGAVVSSNAVKEASLLAARKAAPRESLRGSTGYRKEMVSVLVYRSIEAAVKRLGRDLNG
jgi:CO/xanthine dehydrogenase FAD-binding subunit